MHLRKRRRKPLSLKCRFTGALAPEQRSPPKANIYASINYIYIYIHTRTWSHTQTYFWKQYRGAFWVPQKGAGRGGSSSTSTDYGVPMAVAHAHSISCSQVISFSKLRLTLIVFQPPPCIAAKCSKCEGQCLPGNRFAPTVWFSLVLLSIASLITLYIL